MSIFSDHIAPPRNLSLTFHPFFELLQPSHPGTSALEPSTRAMRNNQAAPRKPNGASYQDKSSGQFYRGLLFIQFFQLENPLLLLFY